MLDRLRSILRGNDQGETARLGRSDWLLAATALLVEAAHMDDWFDPRERERIQALVVERFGEAAEDAEVLVDEAEAMVQDGAEIWGFARAVKDAFTPDERVQLVEMMWEVVYADGELDDFEANLLRRVAGLIYVSDQDSGAARKRALARLGMED